MFPQLERWQQINTQTGDAKQHAARILNIILLSTIAMSLLVLPVMLLQSHKRTFNVGMITITLIALLVLWYVNRRGYTYAASWGFLVSIWLLMTLISLAFRGIHSPFIAMYVVLILLATIIHGPLHGVGFAIAGVVSSTVLFVLQPTPAPAPEDVTLQQSINSWLIHSVVFLLSALLIGFAAERILQALTQLSASERRLAQRNADLEAEIRERQRVEAELIAAEKQRIKLETEAERVAFLQEFISNMTHDLKTPLSTINTSLYLLGREATTAQKTYIDRVYAETNLLNNMVGDILTIAQLDHLPGVALADVDLTTLLTEISDQLQPKTVQKSLVLQTDFSPQLPALHGDRDKLYHAFVNLIDNAINYTPDGGSITVRAGRDDGQIRVSVSDTGIGIAEADLKEIFTRFYRADNARASQPGTGLGLAIVKQVIDLHGGTVSVASEFGKGTTFTVALPVVVKTGMRDGGVGRA